MHNWLLPEYIEDLLPATALRMENLRQALLHLFGTYGYELVSPPLIEYLDSLLTGSGSGSDLDIKTFKLVDQLSGKSMGVRADITPQTARIDAHLLRREGITRLCYAGTVIHTLPERGTGSRELMQLGAELYGHRGYEADVEIQLLMLQALRLAGVKDLYLDLGHVGVLRGLLHYANIPSDTEPALFAAIQAKNAYAIRQLTQHLTPDVQAAFTTLPTLYGGEETLDRAFRELPSFVEISQALEELRAIINELPNDVTLNIDLAELRGYHYQSGVVFAGYTRNHPVPLALGGRFDNVGQSFGRARPATGFSLDLRELANQFPSPSVRRPILAPWLKNAKLSQKIDALRKMGETVIVDLPEHALHRHEYDHDRILAMNPDGEWETQPRPAAD